MSRLLLLACVPFVLFGVACGGGDDDDDENAQGDPTQAGTGPTATPTPDFIPTPPDAAEEDPIVQVSAGENLLTPTMADFRALPVITVDAGGQKEGVSLAELARQVSAPEGTTVTIQGTRRDGRRVQFVRQPLSDIGETSVLVLEEGGRLSFYSSNLPEEQWLINVLVVSFP